GAELLGHEVIPGRLPIAAGHPAGREIFGLDRAAAPGELLPLTRVERRHGVAVAGAEEVFGEANPGFDGLLNDRLAFLGRRLGARVAAHDAELAVALWHPELVAQRLRVEAFEMDEVRPDRLHERRLPPGAVIGRAADRAADQLDVTEGDDDRA